MNKKNKIIFAVDPGSRKLGYACLVYANNKFHKLDSGVLNIPILSECPEDDMPNRLGFIYKNLDELLKKNNPDCFVIEEVFLNINKNIKGILKLGQARGAAIVAAVNNNLKVYEYAARVIKKSVVGKGSADKHQIQYMIKILLNLDYLPQADEADALAIAICHANMSNLNIINYNKSSNKFSKGRYK